MSRFDRLYRDNFPFVWAAAHRCGAPADAVDDVVQDVFVTAYRRLAELSWEVSPRGWLYGVTRRVAFRYRRSAARTARRNAAVGVTSKRSDRPHRRHDAAKALEALLAELAEAQRDVFVMAELLGLSAPEIAAELELPVNTVYSRLRLARRRLTELAGAEALAAGIDALERAERPSARDRSRVHAALVPMLGSPWVGLGAGASGLAKAALWPAIALSVVATTYGITVSGRAEPAPTEAVAAQSPPRNRPDERAAARRQDAEVRAVAIEPVTVPPVGAARPAASGALAAAAPASTVGEAVAPASPGRAKARGPSRGTASDALAQEVALLDNARTKLAGGQPAAALTALREHARRFPNGQLQEARSAHRVRALCKLGRAGEAERVAEDLHRHYPESNLSRSTPKKCEAT